MNIEHLVNNFRLSYQSAVREVCPERLKNAGNDIAFPVIWKNSQGAEGALIELISYDVRDGGPFGFREHVGFILELANGNRHFEQFQVEGGRILGGDWEPANY